MAHPGDAQNVEFDEDNEGELAGHRISPTEVMDVLGEAVWVPNRRHRAADWKALGKTRGGRRLTIVVRYNEDRDSVRPVTGWDATAGERTRYFRR